MACTNEVESIWLKAHHFFLKKMMCFKSDRLHLICTCQQLMFYLVNKEKTNLMSLSFFFLICKTLFFNHDIYKIVKPCLLPIIIVKLGITWQVNKEFKQPMTLTKFYMLINQSCKWHDRSSQYGTWMTWQNSSEILPFFI